MKWVSVEKKLPKSGIRILVYSPNYKKDLSMRYRIVDSQFMPVLIQVTHWARLEPPKKTGEVK